jgi:hypothetical protein
VLGGLKRFANRKAGAEIISLTIHPGDAGLANEKREVLK